MTRIDEIVDGIYRISTAVDVGYFDFQFIQPGDQPPVVSEYLGREMCGFYREMGIFAHEQPVLDVVARIEGLDPSWIHGMHGGSLARESVPGFVRALRDEPFAYRGKVLG